jgi:hypothetical protein
MPISISQQAGIALRAVEFGELPVDAVVRWADSMIITDQRPPQWLIDLSMLKPDHFAEMLQLLHQHAERMESREVDICILAHLFFAGRLSLEQLFQRAFAACSIDYKVSKSGPFQQLTGILCEWDQLDFPDLGQAHWRLQASQALLNCQRECGDLTQFISRLYAA